MFLALSSICSIFFFAPDSAATGGAPYQFQDWYPEKSPFVAVKAAHRERGYPSSDSYALLVDGQAPLSTWVVGAPDGAYIQAQLPGGVYVFREGDRTLWAGDARIQLEFGPPVGWWFSGGVGLGAVRFSRDLLGPGDVPRTSLLYGGFTRWAVPGLDEAFVELRGQLSFAGERMGRFSCGMRWFFSRHAGIWIHGDNFWKRGGGPSDKQSGTFVGLEFRP